MKQGRSLQELAAEIERQATAKRDFTVATNAMEMVLPESLETFTESGIVVGRNFISAESPTKQTPTLALAGLADKFMIDKHAHSQLGAHLNIPRKFYDEQLIKNPDLLAVMVNTLMRREVKPRLVRTLDGKARAIMSNRYRAIDNYDIAPMVFENLMDTQAQVVSADITDTKLYIKALFPKSEAEVAKGDAIQMGVVISNSEIGMGQLSFQPLLYRLVCLNGAIMQDQSLKRRHLGSKLEMDDTGLAMEYIKDDTRKKMDEALIYQLRDTLTAFSSPQKVLEYAEKAKYAMTERITGDPVAAVEVLQKKANLTDDDRGGIMRHLIEGGDLSRWGMANAVTRYSQDVISYDKATELEALGGTIIELAKTDWRAIAEAAA
jgi:hypothetical protein